VLTLVLVLHKAYSGLAALIKGRTKQLSAAEPLQNHQYGLTNSSEIKGKGAIKVTNGAVREQERLREKSIRRELRSLNS
jgi:hypothetical protein